MSVSITAVLSGSSVETDAGMVEVDALAGALSFLPVSALADALLDWADSIVGADLDPASRAGARDHALAALVAWGVLSSSSADAWGLLLDAGIDPAAFLASAAAVVDSSFPSGPVSLALLAGIGASVGAEAGADLRAAILALVPRVLDEALGRLPGRFVRS